MDLLNSLLLLLNKNQPQQNNYPNFTNQNQQSQLMQKLLPAIMSGKPINEVLSSITNTNPIISSVLNMTNKNENKISLDSDKIDTTCFIKIK